ncbi:PIN domain-containing protein, partial [Tumidithrix elongata RA019]|nr:PIN domain-containing protein [Tumidithrix elongata RA019]
VLGSFFSPLSLPDELFRLASTLVFMARIVAVLDSCVLYPLYVRDLLLCAAEAGLYRPVWSEKILNDATSNLVKDGRMLPEKVIKFENAIKKAFPEAMVDVPDELVQIMRNDPGDRHVLATSVISEAEIIVTENVRDFKESDIAPWDKQVMKADKFLTCLYELFPEEMIETVGRQANAKKKPPTSISELLIILEKGVPNFVNNIRFHEKKWEIAEVIRNVLQCYGRTSLDGSKYLQGKTYRIWVNKQSVGITKKESQEDIDILHILGSKATSCLTIEDIHVFERLSIEIENNET